MTTAEEKDGTGAMIRRMVDRTIQRNIKGVQFLTSSPPTVGQTPKDVIAQRGTMKLYHYHPQSEEIYRVPVLLTMATTNRAYVFDLAPSFSLVEFLLKHGFDVFVLDWDPPRSDERGLGLEDYVLDFIPDCVERITRDTGVDEVSIIGYCMGGVLSLLYAALHADGPLKNLICLTTPVDWSEMDLFQSFSHKKYFDVDRLVDSVGIVPADTIMTAFDMLRPANKPAARIQLLDNLWNDDFVRSYRMFTRWQNETLPLAGEYFRQTTKDLLWDNKLFNDTLTVGGQKVDLSKIKLPIMHAIAQHDHIVPFNASKPLISKVGSKDKTEIVLKGGHVSLIAGPNAVLRLWPTIDEWLGERSV
ncbi:MAG: alpha/beta fold hydrolase [Alphaproteobacteria bacterium]|nr:MAG: alpha/beta fold hydrolase [Alphaproteobacteria bacterium]